MSNLDAVIEHLVEKKFGDRLTQLENKLEEKDKTLEAVLHSLSRMEDRWDEMVHRAAAISDQIKSAGTVNKKNMKIVSGYVVRADKLAYRVVTDSQTKPCGFMVKRRYWEESGNDAIKPFNNDPAKLLNLQFDHRVETKRLIKVVCYVQTGNHKDWLNVTDYRITWQNMSDWIPGWDIYRVDAPENIDEHYRGKAVMWIDERILKEKGFVTEESEQTEGSRSTEIDEDVKEICRQIQDGEM